MYTASPDVSLTYICKGHDGTQVTRLAVLNGAKPSNHKTEYLLLLTIKNTSYGK